MRIALVAFMALMFLGTNCTDSNGGRALLEKRGFENIEMGGHAWFQCSDDDFVSNNFTAVDPVSKVTITGAVCRGFWGCSKNWTIRYD